MSRRTLLRIDAAVNLGLGALLIAFPGAIVQALGLPASDSAFYPSILGGVLFGIGLALWVEAGNRSDGSRGLGLWGAATINLCGGAVLAVWLLFGDLQIPVRGAVLLWLLAAGLVGLSVMELAPKKDAGAPL